MGASTNVEYSKRLADILSAMELLEREIGLLLDLPINVEPKNLAEVKADIIANPDRPALSVESLHLSVVGISWRITDMRGEIESLLSRITV